MNELYTNELYLFLLGFFQMYLSRALQYYERNEQSAERANEKNGMPPEQNEVVSSTENILNCFFKDIFKLSQT